MNASSRHGVDSASPIHSPPGPALNGEDRRGFCLNRAGNSNGRAYVPSDAVIQEEQSVTKDSGPENALKGVVEDIKGKAKEVVGEVTGDDSKEHEGRAQQEKAHAQRDVAEHEAKADAARSEASVHEAEQRMHQDD